MLKKRTMVQYKAHGTRIAKKIVSFIAVFGNDADAESVGLMDCSSNDYPLICVELFLLQCT